MRDSMVFNAPKESIKEEDEEYNDGPTGTHAAFNRGPKK